MKLFTKLATTTAVAVLAVGGGASVASAYSISGGAYVGVPQADNQFSVGGAHTYTCPAGLTTFTGTATGSDTTTFTPYYGGTDDCDWFGFGVTVTQSGAWDLKVVGGPVGGWYTGELTIPAGTTTTTDVFWGGCLFEVAGPQSFRHGVGGTIIRLRNTSTGVDLEASVADISHTTLRGCPHASGPDGSYTTNGPVSIPGITIS